MKTGATARHVVIVGGGFSGAMVAVNLARFARQPLSVTVVNRGGEPGRGVAYGTSRPEHLLNVAARNMSALPDRPTHFVEWLGTRCDFSDLPVEELRETFVSRRVYGDYVRSLFESSLRPIAEKSDVLVRTVDADVTKLEADAGGGARVRLDGGEALVADAVVIATGHSPPAPFPGAENLSDDARWWGNPWAEWHRDLPAAGGHIVLLGTGLTMVDAVLTLTALKWEGHITAVSRSGGLPLSHFHGAEYPDYLPDGAETLGLTALVGLVEERCARLRAEGRNPCIAVDKLRPHTQRLWRGLSAADKRIFLRDYAARWNIMRHRIAPQVHRTVRDAIESGRLELRSGRIENLVGTEAGLVVGVSGGDGGVFKLTGDRVINCTGPHARFSETGVPLYRTLLESGLASTDELDMGLRAADDFRVIDRDGNPSSWLYAMGPLLKGMLWETIAVPELRGQAHAIARSLLNLPALAPPDEALIEYSI